MKPLGDAGWFSVMGEVALVGAAAASVVSLLASLLQVNFDYILTPAQQLGIYAGALHNAKTYTLCTAPDGSRGGRQMYLVCFIIVSCGYSWLLIFEL